MDKEEDEDAKRMYTIVFIINASIFLLYTPLMIALITKRKLFLSVNVLLWIQLMTFFVKALADGLRILIERDLNNVYYDLSQIATAICIRLRYLVLYFFVLNIGILVQKLRANGFEEL